MKIFIIIFLTFIYFNILIKSKECGCYSSYAKNKYICNQTEVPIEGYRCCFVKGNLLDSLNEYIQFCYPVDSSKLHKLNQFKEKLTEGYLYGKPKLKNILIDCKQNFIKNNKKFFCFLFLFYFLFF